VAGFFVTVIVAAVVLVFFAALAVEGFRRGDHTGEALARALQPDLEAAAAERDRRRLPEP
jgi:hypothetical protein